VAAYNFLTYIFVILPKRIIILVYYMNYWHDTVKIGSLEEWRSGTEVTYLL